jgi:uncharacterized membrane protein YoaK (UPF0700 family)
MYIAKLDEIPRGILFKWFLMAFLAGDVNAGGFMACERFVTHLTGFASLFGIAAAENRWLSALGMLSVPAFFLLGCMLAAYFTDTAILRRRRPRFGLVMVVAAVLLAAAGVLGHVGYFGAFGSPFVLQRDYFLLVLLCAASGIINTCGTAASSGLMRCTHLTGLTTDLGIGLVRAGFAHQDRKQRLREVRRIWLRAGVVAAFAFGAVIGALSFKSVDYLGFLVPAALAVYCGNLGFRVYGATTAAAALLAVAMVAGAPVAVARGAAKASRAMPHAGPLGLAWGKSPPEAKSILNGKLTFVREEQAGEAPYDTIDQHYAGVFGGLKVDDVTLRYYKGEFFYMLVKIARVQDGATAASPSRVVDAIVSKMRGAYGEPQELTRAPALASAGAIHDNLPLTPQEKAAGLPYLWNEQLRQDEDALFRLKDAQILLGHWDPFGAWRFANDVVVQTFLWQTKSAGPQPSVAAFAPVWIFCKHDRFKAWRAAVQLAEIVAPRDF